MTAFIAFADRVSAAFGKAFGWCLVALTLSVGYEVFVRYLLDDPTPWAYDVSVLMYGTLFMMAGAYALSRNGHVRADLFYRLWPPRAQAGVDIVLYLIFFFPGVTALIVAGWDYAGQSLAYREVSTMSPANVPIFHVKMIIPVAGALLFLQGLAQICRAVLCLRDGAWPPVARDIEETETVIAHEREDEARARATIDRAARGERA
jgi:TRAP-type mannitol/chloroaromatic compound transport system permease small subunit